MRRFGIMTRLLWIFCLLNIVACSSKPVPKAAFSDASVQCDTLKRTDCWSVTPAYVKEHANLFDELIRTKAALKLCQEKK
jgi:hypothetical protein